MLVFLQITRVNRNSLWFALIEKLKRWFSIPCLAALPKKSNVEMSGSSLMLICQNDPPHFAGDDSGGDEVALFFGETNFDDIWLTETLYIIKLRGHGSEWLLEVKSFSVWGAWNQKPKVDALVAELTTAIQTRTDFDFAEYLDDWKRQDEHFDFRIFSEHHFPRPVS